MNILLVGFRYFEIESLQDKLLGTFPEMKVDFAISVRDSWYRLKIASYDLIILDSTSSEIESLTTYQEIALRGDGIPVLMLVSGEELQQLKNDTSVQPEFLLKKDVGYGERIILLLERNEFKRRPLYVAEPKKEVNTSSWQYFQAALAISNTPMILLNRKLEVVEANSSFCSEYQVQKNDAIGKLCFHVLRDHRESNEDSNAFGIITNLFNADLRGGNFSGQSPTLNPSGIIENAAPVKNSKGDVEHVILSLKPNPRRAHADTTAPFDKNLLEVLLNGLSDGLLFCDSENKVILMNQTAKDLLGLAQNQVVGKPIFELPVGDDENWLVEILRNQKSQMRFNSFAYKTKIQNAHVQIRFAPVYSPEKRYLGGFLYMTEVDELKRAEDKEQMKILDKHIINVDKIVTPKVIAEG
ncbi:MAG: PAS domain-containing protein [Candidatus Zhuqueibacterota bacterium]